MTTRCIWLLLVFAAVLPARAQVYDFTATIPYNNAPVNFRIYVPDELTNVNGVIAFSNGTGEDRRYMTAVGWLQPLARTMRYAILGCEFTWINEFMRPETRDFIDAFLVAAANATGRTNLQNAPLFAVGHSQGGLDSIYLPPIYPARTLGYSASKGTDYNKIYQVGQPGWTNVPGLWVPGETDDNGLVNPFKAQQDFEAWRAAGAVAGFALDFATGHADMESQYYDLTALMVSETHRLRHPGTVSSVPGDRPTLIPLTLTSGWLAQRPTFTNTPSAENPRCTMLTRPLFPVIGPYTNYTGGPVTQASWLPSELMAMVYRAHTATQPIFTNRVEVPRQNPLQIETPARLQRFRTGDPIRITVDTREWRDVTRMEFYLNTTKLGEKTDGDWSWDVTSLPPPGVHAIIVVAEDAAGTRYSAYTTIFVHDIPTTGNVWTGLAGNSQMGADANWSQGTAHWEFIENGAEDARDTRSLLVFDGANANNQRTISNSTTPTENPTCWGVRFLPAPGTNAFTLTGFRRTHLGVAGIVNLDDDEQIFNWGQLYVSGSQTWDAFAGPLRIGNGAMNRLRLGFRGSSAPRLQPENSALTLTGPFTITINAPIDGHGALIKEGTGTVILNGTNSWTDSDWPWTIATPHETLRVHRGTLRLGSNATLAATTRAFIAAEPSATLDLNGRPVTFGNLNGGGTLALGSGGVLTLTHEFVKYSADGSVINAYVIPSNFRGRITGGTTGTNALVLQKGGRNLATTLAGNSDFLGRVQVQSGDLYVGHGNALGAGGIGNETYIGSNSVLRLIGTNMVIPETLVFLGQNLTQLVNERGSNTITGPLIYPHTTSPTLTVRNVASNSVLTLAGGFVGGSVAGQGVYLRLEPAAFGARIVADGGITDGTNGGVARVLVSHASAPTGVVRLSGTNSYSGSTILVRGTLWVGADAPATGNGALGSSAGGSILLSRSGDTVTNDTIALLTDGPVTVGRTIDVRNFNSAGTTTLGGASPHESFFTGQIFISTEGRNVQLAAAPGGRVTFAGRIRDEAVTSSLTVIGPGTVVLSFNGNTYDGGTVVAGGTLLVANTTGSATGTGGVTVQSGARFGGTGAVSGSVTCVSGARLVFDLITPPASHDRLDVGGALTLNNTPIDLTSSNGGATTGTYVLVQAASISGTPGPVSAPAGLTGTAAVVGNELRVTLTPVLTPLQAWRLLHFGTTENAGNAANSADPDDDGVANLLEYALGTVPTDRNSVVVPALSTSANRLRLTFTPSVVNGLRYLVEATGNLAGWPEQTDVTSLLAPGVSFTHTDTVDIGSASQRFLRLRVEPL
ncbi:MAG: Ig-like domain-containing protein [Verrucomicrobiae bacterium]|nr:Ig-like domain-containing protein [Verrucomicrobiae bacterium]